MQVLPPPIPPMLIAVVEAIAADAVELADMPLMLDIDDIAVDVILSVLYISADNS